MATLVAIGFTVTAGVAVFSISMAAFGIAMRRQNNFIATRCVARPPTVIYNPHHQHRDPSQDRGSAFWGWIPWAMRLTYATMLGGVPGTGTREGGLSGLMLKVNLDGIVLLRFHHLCLRVCSLAAFLYLVVVLPLYKTAQCSRVTQDDDYHVGSDVCVAQNLTDYQRLTMANIPPLNLNATDYQSFGGIVQGFFLPVHDGVLARLYAVVFVTWIVTMYAFHELETEWRDVLALRRVYFLEADIWSDRNAELEETLLRDEREKNEDRDQTERVDDDDDDDDGQGNGHDEERPFMSDKPATLSHGTQITLSTSDNAATSKKDEKSYRKSRDPWIPHPEQRDTVPNVELYSVLVGGLPSLPTEAFVREEVEAMFSRKQAIDWQLSVTAAFFDHCVPNQPGFSSSVAAVTILPSASQITDAWNHWYRAAAKLRKLRFIRRQIAKVRGRESLLVNAGNDGGMVVNGDDEGDAVEPERPQSSRTQKSEKEKRRRLKFERKKKKRKKVSVYGITEEKKQYYQEVLGTEDDLDVEYNLLHALNLGPEQTAVYSREFAQGAANLAPYGWNERKVRNASLEKLLEMEKMALVKVEEANAALKAAQEKVVESSSDGGDSFNDDHLETIMKRASSMESGESLALESFDQVGDVESHAKREPMEEHTHDIEAGGDLVEKHSNLTAGGTFSKITSKAILETIANPLDLVDLSIRGSLSVADHSLRASMNAMNAAGQSIRNLGSLADTIVPQRRMSNGHTPKQQIPADISLEAGLFLKQRQLNGGQSQVKSKGYAPKRSKSLDALPGPQVHREDCSGTAESTSGPGRVDAARSNLRHSGGPRRSRSSDNVDILVGVAEEDDPEAVSVTSVSPVKPNSILRSPSLTQSSTQLEESSSTSLFNEDSASQHRDSRITTEKTEDWRNEGKEETIWEKIARENDRRISLRTRLSNVKSGSFSSSTTSSQKCVHFASAPQLPSVSSSVSRAQVHFSSNPDSLNREPKIAISSKDGRMVSIREGNDGHDSWNSFDFENGVTVADDLGLSHPFDDSKRSQSESADENLRLAYDFEEKAGLRRRQSNATMERISKDSNAKWSKVVQIVNETSRNHQSNNHKEIVSSGKWSTDGPILRSALETFCYGLSHVFRPFQIGLQTTDLVDQLASESHYAVVTFTSRQAAVAARHVLADSRGSDRWVTVNDVPSPPLADAPVCSASGFRGCVRPVTISINEKQKLLRHLLAYAMLICIYFFYTFPLTRAQQLVSPERLGRVIPDLDKWLENSVLNYMFEGFIPALVWTAFFAVCPPMFKAIANFGSNATSSPKAEGSALQYFWWFMVLAAFTGTSLQSALIEGFNSGLNIGAELQSVVVVTAQTIPTEVSATWLNWMIVRVSMVLPTQYLLQLNSFIFTWLGLKCCARTVRGGGSGGPVPYRIYVDSGVVMLCLFALGPASPLISAASFMYFLFCVPMLRWTMIFLYKPRFDLGGKRFPFIFDMCVSGMIVGQILLVTMMTLRRAFGPAVAAFLPIVPTIVYRWMLRRRYLRAFSDVALLQTSLLDGWDTNEESCVSKREEFRQFLVDCHKAAYVPVCIASDQGTLITSEPAAVIPLETDVEDFDDMTSVNESVFGGSTLGGGSVLGGSVMGAGSVLGNGSVSAPIKSSNPLYHAYQPQKQPGLMVRRASTAGVQRSPVRQMQMRKLHNEMLSHIEISADNNGFSHPPLSPTVNSPKRTAPRAKFVSPLSARCRKAGGGANANVVGGGGGGGGGNQRISLPSAGSKNGTVLTLNFPQSLPDAPEM